MLTVNDLDRSQTDAIDHLITATETLLIAPTGSGKTVVALTAADELMAVGVVKRMLIVCPLKVAQLVWSTEHLGWQHLHTLKVGVAIEGSRDKVFKRIERFDIVVINYEQLIWMAANDKFKHFDGIIFDEVTRLSNGGAWFKSVRRFIKTFKWRCAMTAVPVTESFLQLFYIQFCVDGGKALGRNRDKHLRKFFYPLDFQNRKWGLFPGAGDKLAALIEPTIHVMPDYKDTLPKLTITHVPVPLPADAMRVYKDMAGTMQAEGVTAQTSAAQMGKLSQIASGFVYTETESIEVHYEKMDALDELIMLAKGESIIIVYQFEEEKERLKEYYPAIRFLGKNPQQLLTDWNAGKVHLLAMHIRSGSHGLNLQAPCCKMILMGPCWSQDQTTQVADRLWRRGQKRAVDVAVLVAKDTVDEVIVARLNDKAALHPAFLAHIAEVTKKAPRERV